MWCNNINTDGLQIDVWSFRQVWTLGGDKENMLTHTYLKPIRKIKVTICNHQSDSPFYVWPDV